MSSDAATPPSSTTSGRRWGLFQSTGSTPSTDNGLQPAMDPRTTPVPSGLEIHVLEGEDAGKTFPLDTWEIVLGRRMTPEEKKTGWMLFNEPTVSRMHAVLEWRPGPRRYRIEHQSRTNPTLINGRQVQQAILYPDDIIRIGDLSFQLRQRGAQPLDELHHPQVADRGLIYSGFKVSVVKGPDLGKQFVLEHKVLHVGGPEARTENTPDNWLVLDDPALPREQAFLVWYDAEKRYGIFHAGSSPVPTQISRVLHSTREEMQNEARNLLNLDDAVILGDTVLMFLKHERFLETGRAFQKELAERMQAAQPEPPDATSADAPAPASSPATSPEASEASGPPAPRRKAFDFTSGRRVVEIRPTEIETPSEALVPTHDSEETSERLFEQTSNWFVRPDYVLEFLQGPEMGRQVTLQAAAFRNDRPITIGSRGKRNNAIELQGAHLDNELARISYRGGRFSLVKDARARALVAINDVPLDEGRSKVLKNGDELTLGEHLVLFIDRQALDQQFQFELEVLRENGADGQGRRLALTHETTTLGRSKQCRVRLDDANVSRVHAEIGFARGGFVLRHRSATNPTFINGVSLNEGDERLLENGDEISLSERTTFVFRKRNALEAR